MADNPHILKRRRNESLLNADDVRWRLNYNPVTGILTWKVPSSNRAKVGAPAGYLNKLGYIRVRIGDCLYMASRLAWLHHYGEWPSETIDHINGNTADNSIANLREVNDSQNQANQKRSRSNVTGYKGVGRKSCGKYAAVITVNRKAIYLGRFSTPELAYAAYCEAARKYFGEYARLE